MEKIPVIVGIGELLWDELPTGRKMGGLRLILFTMLRSWVWRVMLSVLLAKTIWGIEL